MTFQAPLLQTGDAARCPGGSVAGVAPGDVLALVYPKRMVVQRTSSETGDPELHLYYGDKDISFDEPHLFHFAETLARTPRFVAADSATWGDGLDWDDVRPLLEALIAGGILVGGDDVVDAERLDGDRTRPSPLTDASCATPRWWSACEDITGDLTGRRIEAGWLELVVPVFRVAHVALDADGRQVGEANVFPRALRLGVPSEWLACIYPGTRYLSDRPMNATALRSMRAHWPAMMGLLATLRNRFLAAFPEARKGWTVATLERFATLVLAVPTYQLVRTIDPVANGALHPVLSNLFRVTDGLRMTMHQMLFVPVGEPTLSPDEPMDAGRIHDYAERNFSFHSETGVCAGPRVMVRAFLETVIDGGDEDIAGLEPDVRRALDDTADAFAYGLRGLRAHAALFCMWPAMARAYEDIADLAADAVTAGQGGFIPLRDRMRGHLGSLRHLTYLGSAERRISREAAYAAIYDGCGRGLPDATSSLADAFSRARPREGAALLADIGAALGGTSLPPGPWRDRLAQFLAGHALETQAILRVAAAEQLALNAGLGRPPATRPFSAADADAHALLQGHEVRRLPFLLDELRDLLGINLAIATDTVGVGVAVDDRAKARPLGNSVSAGMVSAGCGANCATKE